MPSKKKKIAIREISFLLVCVETLTNVLNGGEEKILHLTSEQEKDMTHFTDKDTGVELELEENMPFLEWLANNYKNFGATLEIITDRSQEGSQFVRGFGGIGGMLRYKVDFQSMQCDQLDDEEFDLDDY